MPLPTTYAGFGSPNPGTNASLARPPYAAQANSNMAPVQLEVMVPDSDAQVWVEGVLTKTRGRDRIYVTAPLEKGYAYTYNIRAVWYQEGQEIALDRRVQITPGTARLVDFTIPDLPVHAQTIPVLPPPTFDP